MVLKGYSRHHGPVDFWGQRDGEADKKASVWGSGVACRASHVRAG